jgi:hypothetical protein
MKMMTVKQYSLPTLSEGLVAIQAKRRDLQHKYMFGFRLDSEELDWMDWAESVLDGDSQKSVA